jgi:hypothetical protein
MIRYLSESLQAILQQPGLPSELAEAEIVFDRPAGSFNPQRTTIDLFLYDIRENTLLRDNGPTIARNNNRATIRHLPPLRIDCTYLITAWPTSMAENALQEHRLLSQVLQVFACYPTIPPNFLPPALRNQDPPLPLLVTSADSIKNPAEFWTSLGTPLRASLAVTVTVSIDPFSGFAPPPEDVPLVDRSVPQLELDRFLLEGVVRDIDSEPIAGASLQLVESGETATSSTDGYYRFSFVAPGVYTLRVQPTAGDSRDFPVTVPSLGGKYNLKLT